MRWRFRNGFTLIELLVVVAILGIMVTAGVVSITSGQGAARTRGAARDVVASIRQARSVALVSMQPATIAFSNESTDGETVAHVKISSVKLMSTNAVTRATTLDGEEISLAGEEEEARPIRKTRSHTVNGEEPVVEEASGGEDISDILFAPVSDEVMRGIRLKVLTGEAAETATGGSGVSAYSTADASSKSRISVFSTADYINSRYQEKVAQEKAEAMAKEESSETSSSADTEEEGSGPVSIVWEVNGRTEPHCVWVYRDGTKPEEGLLIKVDRFGAVKVLSGDGRENED